MIMTMNEWTVSGKVSYMRELTGNFAASIKIKGEASRKDHAYASDELEFGCLLGHKVYEEAKQKGLKIGRYTTLSGHLETWDKTIHGKPTNKVMFVADYVLEVA